MGVIQTIERFPYKGKAYNFTVSGTEHNSKIKKLFFEGMVHPDYPIYKNSGTVCKASEVKVDDLIMDRDDTFWKVEICNEYYVEEEFQQITLDDGRIIKCNLGHKLMIVSPKNCAASTLEIGDKIKDHNIHLLTRHVKQPRITKP